MRCLLKRNAVLAICSAVLLFSLGLAGCGGGSDEGSDTGETGDLAVSITDGAGDFQCYTVAIDSLVLTKANGAEVSALPVATTVDLSQYAEMTEFLTAATIPSGYYTSAQMTLNYTNALVYVEDQNGDTVRVTNIVDEDGNPVTTLTVDVAINDLDEFLIAPGVPVHLVLDFDLTASNRVSFDGGGVPTLTVSPILTASINPSDFKVQRLRGPLEDVDVESNSFSLHVCPFYHPMADAPHFGALDVLTDENTMYDINGNTYRGATGMTAMDALSDLTAVIVIGELKLSPYRFEADEVRAGSSVPGGTLDVVAGNVLSRSGDTVILKGATLHRTNGSVIFNDRVEVTLSDQTRVTRQLSLLPHDIDEISICQRLTVFGTLTDDTLSSMALDATEGYARMHLTMIRGSVATTSASQVNLDVQSVDARSINAFDFTGAGTDVDPSDYEVNTGTLDISGLPAGTPIKFKGFVSPFGDAPPDFTAQTMIDVRKVRAVLIASWIPYADNALATLSTTKLVIDMTEASKMFFHHLGRGGFVHDLSSFSSDPVIEPKDADDGLYIVKRRGVIQVFNDYEEFVQSVEEMLNDGHEIKKIFAAGLFDDSSTTLTADHIEVRFF